MHKILLTLSVLAAASVSAAVQAPANLNGCEIQFSYSPSWKFTPLLMGLGKAEPGTTNTYTVQGESLRYNVTYAPQATASKALLTVEGKRNKATIRMTFHTATCGTAHMKWNGADCFDLTFRVQENAAPQAYLQRMGDPVGDVIPTSLAGKVLEIDFGGAFECRWNPDTEETSYHASNTQPMSVQFPVSGNNFTCQGQDGTPLAVQYELRSCGAIVSIVGGQEHSIEISLDFANSESGLAHIYRIEGDNTWTERAARFRIRPATTDDARVNIPPKQGEDDTLADLIRGLENITYPTAVERLYQKRLLSILPQIAQGAPVNTIIPNANGTTALHNACGLSHAELVQWLINHGADTTAKTAKGAGVDACVGGKNARVIRTILQKAKTPQ